MSPSIISGTSETPLGTSDIPLATYANRWPRQYRFGQEMRSDFDTAGMADLLRTQTVATNIVFPQAKDFGRWRGTALDKRWLPKSRTWLDRLIVLMGPRAIPTYGSPAFQELTGLRKYGGQCAQGAYRGIPVVGCSHYSRNKATPEEREEAMARVREVTGG